MRCKRGTEPEEKGDAMQCRVIRTTTQSPLYLRFLFWYALVVRGASIRLGFTVTPNAFLFTHPPLAN
jgi:hypothetical protein